MSKKRTGIALALLLVATSAFAATIPGVTVVANNGYGTVTWEALAKNDSGRAASVGAWRGVKTVQIIVTSAGEQSVSIQGSMDGTNWVTLHGVELDSGEYFSLTGITASSLITIIEDPLYVRPLISNGAGATAVDVDVIVGAYAR